ncbi:DUF2953 domain-containing protein [archaeon]|nr:DUF2953 domain-containing protein [archaeon]
MVLFILSMILLLLLLAVLLIPFNIHIISKKTDKNIKAYIDILWLFNTIQLKFNILKQIYSIHIFNKNIFNKKLESKKKSKKNKKTKHTQKTHTKQTKKKEIFSKDIIQPTFKLAKNIIQTFSIKKAYLNLNLGLSNKAETGIINGYFYALKKIAPNIYNHKNITILFEPNFNNEQFDYNAKIKISNQLKNFINPIFTFLLSKPIRTMIKNSIFRK